MKPFGTGVVVGVGGSFPQKDKRDIRIEIDSILRLLRKSLLVGC